jgi:hypothetical protein
MLWQQLATTCSQLLWVLDISSICSRVWARRPGLPWKLCDSSKLNHNSCSWLSGAAWLLRTRVGTSKRPLCMQVPLILVCVLAPSAGWCLVKASHGCCIDTHVSLCCDGSTRWPSMQLLCDLACHDIGGMVHQLGVGLYAMLSV